MAKDRREAVTLDPVAGEMSTSELMSLIRAGGPFAPGAVVSGEEVVEATTELLRQTAHPDYITVMASEAITQDYSGVEGFEEAWTDWLSPYESFRVEVDEVIPLDDKLVITVRQIATTRHSAVEVETQSAAVWWFEDGQVRQAGFYLDRQAGLKAAGIAAPDRPPSG
jgi:SnoaL-like domain